MRKVIIDQKPKAGKLPKTIDQGNKKLISKSKIRKRIATR